MSIDLYRRDLREALGRGGKALSSMRLALEVYGAGVLDEPDDRTWLWSDIHFGHANIISYCNRPFGSPGEMDAALWSAWESMIGPDDALVCLGDVAFREGNVPATWARVRAAPGRMKALVVGNHDLNADASLRVQHFDPVRALLISPGDPPLIFTHAPLPNVPAGHVNVHGHTHDRMARVDGPHICVSVEQIEYRPIRLERLRRLARRLAAGETLAGDTTLKRVRLVEGLAS